MQECLSYVSSLTRRDNTMGTDNPVKSSRLESLPARLGGRTRGASRGGGREESRCGGGGQGFKGFWQGCPRRCRAHYRAQ